MASMGAVRLAEMLVHSTTSIHLTEHAGTAAAMQRYSALAADFKNRYGEPVQLFARAPGRVNIIGEHVDYEGYGVLPMAIARDTVVAIALAGTSLDVSNHVDNLFPAYTFVPDPTQLLDTENHVWANYALAAYKGVHDFLAENPAAQTPLSRQFPGIKLLVHGTVPHGSGLSSSAALVVAVAVAILGAYGCSAQQEDVAQFACAAERYVGVNGGGMDQAIAVMARPGEASYIQFDPVVSATPVAIPQGCTFVVAHSLAESFKQLSAALRYNLRVVECRMAAIVLGVKLGLPAAKARELRTLKELESLVQSYYNPDPTDEGGGDKRAMLPADVQLLDRCADAAQRLLSDGVYSAEEVREIVQHPLDEIFADLPGSMDSITAAQDVGFHLQARAVHVFSEASRVLRFRNICNNSDSPQLKHVTLGGLMRKSHESLREKYDCSCPELDELMVHSKRLGALGSRLTGAGWGGASVHLVRNEKVATFIDALKRDFYVKKLQADAQGNPPSAEMLDDVVFATTPGHGAAIATKECIVSL